LGNTLGITLEKVTCSPSDRQLWSLLDFVHFAVARVRSMELAPFGITVEQAALLFFVQQRGGVTIAKQIEELTFKQHNSISASVNRMCRLGLMTRRPAPGKRSKEIMLTSKGESILRTIPMGSLKVVFGVLEVRERREFSDCLHTLLGRAKELLGTPTITPFMKHLGGEDSAQHDIRDKNPSEHSLWSALDGATFCISRLRQMELTKFGLTVEQSSVIQVLGSEGRTAKTLSQMTLRQHNSISIITSRMIRTGLLEKEKFPGRASIIRLTRKGVNLREGVSWNALALTFSSLTSDQRTQLREILSCLRVRVMSLLDQANV
jgi:DNA-binding MarR family transcriptional regulator